MNKAIILLSGGLDSVVSLAITKEMYSEIFALTFDYSQKSANQETNSANKISKYYGIENKVIKLDWLGDISNSSLNKNIEIPSLNEKELKNKILAEKNAKSVWVPNRNALFINIAASFAEAYGFNHIIIGANKEEGETFIDNSIDFINAVNVSLQYSVNSKINVISPLIDMNKTDIVKKGIELNIPFNLIYSCYNGNDIHCGKCESCIRLKSALKFSGKNDIMKGIFEETYENIVY